MTLTEMWAEAKRIYDASADEYDFIGIRFENKERVVGEICECSKHNTDREDERDFPEFGTEEYSEMQTFDGTSAWDLSQENAYKVGAYGADRDATLNFMQDHCYIVAGNHITNRDDGLDDGEIVIEDAKVIAQLF